MAGFEAPCTALATDAALLHATAGFANTFDLTLMAKGVETPKQHPMRQGWPFSPTVSDTARCNVLPSECRVSVHHAMGSPPSGVLRLLGSAGAIDAAIAPVPALNCRQAKR